VDTLTILNNQKTAGSLRSFDCGSAIILIDLAKAYDTVDWNYLVETVDQLEPPDLTLSFWVNRLYQPHHTTISDSEVRLEVNQGVKQGDPLSPHLFNFVIQRLFNAVRQNRDVQSMWVEGSPLSVAYADDVAFYCSIPSISHVIGEIEKWSLRSGVKTNYNKSFILVFPGNGRDGVIEHSTGKTGSFEELQKDTLKAAAQKGFNIRIKDGLNQDEQAGEYLGFPVFLDPIRMSAETGKKVLTKVKAACGRIKRLYMLRATPLNIRANLFNQYVTSIPVYYSFGISTSKELQKALNVSATNIVWLDRIVHPGKGTYQRHTRAGGLGLVPPDVVNTSSIMCALFLLLRQPGPSWHLRALRIMQQRWGLLTGKERKYMLSSWWGSSLEAVGVHGGEFLPRERQIITDPTWEDYVAHIERETLRKTISDRWAGNDGGPKPIGWHRWWSFRFPVRILNFGYLVRCNRLQGGPRAHGGKTENYVCPLCNGVVDIDNCLHFSRECRIIRSTVNSCAMQGMELDLEVLKEWTALFDEGRHSDRLQLLSWILYIMWYGYHRATYKPTASQARKVWKEYRKHMDRLIYLSLGKQDQELLRWFDNAEEELRKSGSFPALM